jgi:hypothetical protein
MNHVTLLIGNAAYSLHGSALFRRNRTQTGLKHGLVHQFQARKTAYTPVFQEGKYVLSASNKSTQSQTHPSPCNSDSNCGCETVGHANQFSFISLGGYPSQKHNKW